MRMSVGLLPKCCGFITLSASVISLSLAPQHPTVEDLLSPDQAGFRKGRSTCNLYSNDLPVTRGRKFIYADDIVSTFKANTSANWNAVSRQIWRGCHTSVDSGDLNQAFPKQSAVCSTCIIPGPPVNCQFIWMASAFGMSATQ